MPDTSEVRSFLSVVAGQAGRSARIPPLLHALARHCASGRGASRDEVDDVVAQFLLKTVEGKSNSRSADALLAMADTELLAALRVRLRQTAAELKGRAWLVRKQLRAHVAEVLADNSASRCPGALPLTLVRDGRLCRDRIRVAVSFLVHRERLQAEPSALTQELLVRYQLQRLDAANLAPEAPANPEEEVGSRRDAVRRAAELRRALGPLLPDLLMRRTGMPLRQIAANSRVAISTAHSRVLSAEICAREFAFVRDVEPAELDRALAAASLG
jgi:hypothetical protein